MQTYKALKIILLLLLIIPMVSYHIFMDFITCELKNDIVESNIGFGTQIVLLAVSFGFLMLELKVIKVPIHAFFWGVVFAGGMASIGLRISHSNINGIK